jgi:hypothetical protein
MLTIHKQVLEVTDRQDVRLPWNARVLSVQVQQGLLCVWYLCDDEIVTKEPITFYVIGTGHRADHVSQCTFLGTVQLDGGRLVFHVFVK